MLFVGSCVVGLPVGRWAFVRSGAAILSEPGVTVRTRNSGSMERLADGAWSWHRLVHRHAVTARGSYPRATDSVPWLAGVCVRLASVRRAGCVVLGLDVWEVDRDGLLRTAFLLLGKVDQSARLLSDGPPTSDGGVVCQVLPNCEGPRLVVGWAASPCASEALCGGGAS
jgi:hypothetical protein